MVRQGLSLKDSLEWCLGKDTLGDILCIVVRQGHSRGTFGPISSGTPSLQHQLTTDQLRSA